jgi:hypothetical protein
MGWALEVCPAPASKARVDMELGGGWLETEDGIELEPELGRAMAI